MLTEICQYLHNWFNRKPDGSDYPKQSGTIAIENGELITSILAGGQYFRVIGSLFNDGVHKYGDSSDVLKDEEFDGEIWSMGVPLEVVKLSKDIDEWAAKYGTIDSEAMSPFASESFGGYTYSKGSGGLSGSQGNGWQDVFAARLNVWRKI